MSHLALAAALQVALAAAAQSPRPEPPRYSLAAWSERAWNRMADRGGGIFGRLAEEGILQRYHPLQDHEYRLDELTAGFALADEGAWLRTENGFRAWGGSISNRNFVNRAEARFSIPVAHRVRSGLRLWQEESLEAERQRVLFTLGVDSLVGGWTGWFGITLEFMKPDADLEWGLRRRLGERLDLSFAFAVLDAFNDFIFVKLRVDSAETDVFREYRRQPLAVRFAADWRPAARWRLEAVGGGSNRARLEGDIVADDRAGFDQAERVRYVGLLGEWTPRGDLAVGAFARRIEAESRREYAAADSVSDFDLLEATAAAGAYALFRPSADWDLEGAVLHTHRRERRRGADARDGRDREWTAWASGSRRLTRWLFLSLGYFYDDRAPSADVPFADALAATNQRLRTDLVVRFPSGARLGAGVNWDLDSPTDPRFFDGAHGRLVVPF